MPRVSNQSPIGFLFDDRSKGTEFLAEFDLGVEVIFHLGMPRVGQDRSRAERPRSPFVSSVQNPDHLAGGQPVRDFSGNVGTLPVGYLVHRQGRPDHRLGVADPEIGGEAVAVGRTALAPPHGRLQGGSQRSAGVSSGRMDVGADIEIPDHSGIGSAIERDTAGKAKIFCLVVADKPRQDLSDGDFERLLHR